MQRKYERNCSTAKIVCGMYNGCKMKKVHIKKLTIMCLAAALLFNPIHSSAAILKKGTSNKEVKNVQKTLKNLGYFKYPKVTGYYGSRTESAVIKFQKAYGLTPDGIVGKKTKQALIKNAPQVKSAVYTKAEVNATKAEVNATNSGVNATKTGANATKVETKITKTEVKAIRTSTTAKKTTLAKSGTKSNGVLDWFNEVQYIWDRGTNATVTDIDTGKSFQVKRTYGTNHADVEPLTKKDAQIIKDIWGGWSWERRAVVVTVGDMNLAGSMTAVPHAGVESAPANTVVNNRSEGYGRGENLDAVKGNGVSGVMDIHFLNSRTHSSNSEQKSHQDMVKKAGAYIGKNGL
jgi:peptidoglycan hydrolase-like protein with peptidoglycan-binding domain